MSIAIAIANNIFFVIIHIITLNISFFNLLKPSAAPNATPRAIQVGSFVAAKTAAPIAVPTPIQPPVFLKLLFFSLSYKSKLAIYNYNYGNY